MITWLKFKLSNLGNRQELQLAPIDVLVRFGWKLPGQRWSNSNYNFEVVICGRVINH